MKYNYGKQLHLLLYLGDDEFSVLGCVPYIDSVAVPFLITGTNVNITNCYNTANA